MAIPSALTLRLSLLEIGAKGAFHVQDATKLLSDQFNLTQKERERLHPKGKIPVIHDRVIRTAIWLVNNRLLHRIQTGRHIITEKGVAALDRNPVKIDKKLVDALRAYPATPVSEIEVMRIRRKRKGMPNFQAMMLPALRLSAKGEFSVPEAAEAIADEFNLTDEERRKRTSSGTLTVRNRLSWAVLDLLRAKLLDRPSRGRYTITERGQEVLDSYPEEINIKFLEQYSEFREYRSKWRTPGASSEALQTEESLAPQGEEATPEDRIQTAHDEITDALKEELLSMVMKAPPVFFEELTVKLLLSMGYGGFREEAGQRTGKSGDEGLDGMINEDKLGLDVIYIQAKRFHPDSMVGRPEIQKFVGSLVGKGANKGVFVTTASYSKQARDYAANISQRLVLIDGEKLVSLMIEHDVGVRTKRAIELKEADEEFFAD